jgi:hypothetical protein
LVVIGGPLGLALLASDLILTLPVASVEGEDALLHGTEAAHHGRVHTPEVVLQAGVEAELEAAAKSGFVPLELGGKGVEPDDVSIDTVRILHDEGGELALDEAEVVRVSETLPKDVPEVVSHEFERGVRLA